MQSAFHASDVALYDGEDLPQASVGFAEGLQFSFAEQRVAISRPAAKRAAVSARCGQNDPARAAQVADERT
jgi:hypothetical protein